MDLPAYFERIGYTGPREPTHAVLEAVHLAHASSIPFENLDILLGEPIRLDMPSLEAKLVRARRGGYCFEQNLLMAAALEELGFNVTRLAARVRYGISETMPRLHMALMAAVDGQMWLCDAGFGAEGLLKPVPFGSGEEAAQFLWRYRVAKAGDTWILQSLRRGEWADLYGFTLEPQELVDYEVANFYTSTHPSSRFRKGPTAQITRPDGRTILRYRELITDRGEEVTRRTLSDEELLPVLAEQFGLRLPAGTLLGAV